MTTQGQSRINLYSNDVVGYDPMWALERGRKGALLWGPFDFNTHTACSPLFRIITCLERLLGRKTQHLLQQSGAMQASCEAGLSAPLTLSVCTLARLPVRTWVANKIKTPENMIWKRHHAAWQRKATAFPSYNLTII